MQASLKHQVKSRSSRMPVSWAKHSNGNEIILRPNSSRPVRVISKKVKTWIQVQSPLNEHWKMVHELHQKQLNQRRQVLSYSFDGSDDSDGSGDSDRFQKD
jgi:hypothetical protein